MSKCVYCGSPAYGRSCGYGPGGVHSHSAGSDKCRYCGSVSYGPGCSYSPQGVHVHGPGNICVYCGSVSFGPGCRLGPDGVHDRFGSGSGRNSQKISQPTTAPVSARNTEKNSPVLSEDSSSSSDNEALGMLIGAAAALFLIVCLILSPGILLNYITERLPVPKEKTAAFLQACMQDQLTWIVSLSFWTVLAIIVVLIVSRIKSRK